MTKVRRALVSVSEKRGLVELARTLVKLGVQILSTGGTAKALGEAGIPVVQVSAHTGAPEILEGRVKTLHPRIHGGLLGRPIASHEAEMAEHDILPIDLVVVNLYPFRETVAKPGVEFADAVENIDIGGPSMLRSAAKNHERVGVVVDPADYAAIAAELEQGNGSLTPGTRFRLAAKAFAHTAAYDAAIASFMSSLVLGDDGVPKAQVERRPFPDVLAPQWHLARALRYGENPHQHAAFYGDLPAAPAGVASLATADVLQGKELSYNNLLDLDAALGCVLEFQPPAAVIVKHTNPCGVAVDERGVAAAYRKARETDPTSAFGGIVAVNRAVGEELAKELEQTFLECVIAPAFDEAARQILARKKNLRLVATGEVKPDPAGWALRSVAGGILVQSRDARIVSAAEARVVTKRAPTPRELAGLDFAWRVGKHVKSNAIIFVRDGQTVGVGAGQMSRIDSVKIAVSKAQLPVPGTVASSDAFFPFRDGLDAIAAAGATAIIQPGGSVKDEEVIAAADEHGMAMLFTAMRHFRH